MIPDSLKCLWDAREAAAAIVTFTQGKTATDYAESELLRSAVERQFGIIGRALAQFEKVDPTTAGQIPNLRNIVRFDDDIVWRIVQEDLPRLRRLVEKLLDADDHHTA